MKKKKTLQRYSSAITNFTVTLELTTSWGTLSVRVLPSVRTLTMKPGISRSTKRSTHVSKYANPARRRWRIANFCFNSRKQTRTNNFNNPSSMVPHRTQHPSDRHQVATMTISVIQRRAKRHLRTINQLFYVYPWECTRVYQLHRRQEENTETTNHLTNHAVETLHPHRSVLPHPGTLSLRARHPSTAANDRNKLVALPRRHSNRKRVSPRQTGRSHSCSPFSRRVGSKPSRTRLQSPFRRFLKQSTCGKVR